jgi:hypothetical protein
MSASVFAPANPTPGSIKAVYAHLDCLVEGIDQLKKAGFADMIVTAPLPRHEIEELIYEGRPSPIRWFTLSGALFGSFMGFSVCSLTHLNWPMIIPAGKPLVSIPAFMVLTFEATVLFGCLFTLIGLIVMCRLPSNDLQVECTDPRFSDDKFGLVLNGVVGADADRIRNILNGTGAIETSGMEAANA